MITPQLYPPWKGAKWIGKIKFRDYDELGYWGRGGYSNTAKNLGLMLGILSHLPLDLLSRPNMCRIAIVAHQPFEQNPLLLRP